MANVPVAGAEVENNEAAMLGLGGRLELDSRLKRPALAEAGIDGDSVGYDDVASLGEYLNAQTFFECWVRDARNGNWAGDLRVGAGGKDENRLGGGVWRCLPEHRASHPAEFRRWAIRERFPRQQWQVWDRVQQK